MLSAIIQYPLKQFNLNEDIIGIYNKGANYFSAGIVVLIIMHANRPASKICFLGELAVIEIYDFISNVLAVH